MCIFISIKSGAVQFVSIEIKEIKQFSEPQYLQQKNFLATSENFLNALIVWVKMFSLWQVISKCTLPPRLFPLQFNFGA